MPNSTIRDRLLALAREDLATRERLAANGTLYSGYHPEMQAIHESNALALEEIIEEIGWPTKGRVGKDGSEAAWIIAQHAIGLPEFQRRCLSAIKGAVQQDEAPAWQYAMLLDRIRVFEGRTQLYGTSFDWDEEGNMSPLPIEASDLVDHRRLAVGLPNLAEAIAAKRAETQNEPRPSDFHARQQSMHEWARDVGWRT